MNRNSPFRKRPRASRFHYQVLEPKQMLSAYFPAFVNDQLTLGDPAASSPYALSQTFLLESKPDASKTIFLDFDGHRSVNNSWNHDIDFPAFNFQGSSSTFTQAELNQIQRMFQNVAEDFLPFDVNVTTRDPGVAALTRSSFFDNNYGIRVINTQATDGFGDGIGGVAFRNSFNDSIDNPVFTFNKGVNAGGQTNSHEVGHSLGLLHDGLNGSEYHPGTGSGEVSWGPILGAPFSSNITQWSDGSYAGATNTQDDLAVINSFGVGFRDDDHGSSLAAASTLDLNNTDVFDWGIIERNTDRDFFRFTTSGGNVRLNVDAFGENPNLDVLARLHRADGTVIQTSNPNATVDASFNVTLGAGTYYISVEGTGRPGAYTDYGSLGFYSISGDIPGSQQQNTNVGETGRLNINHVWTTVNLRQSYNDPVVVGGPTTRFGGDPITVRIRNVTADSFQIRLDEFESSDGTHIGEWVDYLVLEAGTHELDDGTVIVAGNADGQTHQWQSYSFGTAFANSPTAPVVFTQTVTTNEDVAVANRLQTVTRNGFELRLQEQEASDRIHVGESVSFIAIEVGVGTTGNSRFESFRTTNSVTHRNYEINFQNDYGRSPIFLAAIQTFDGGDTATVRYRNLLNDLATVFIEEELSADSETGHATEVVGYLALDNGLLSGRSIFSFTGGSSSSGGSTSNESGDSGTFDSVQFEDGSFQYDSSFDSDFYSNSGDGHELIAGLPGPLDHDHDDDHDHGDEVDHDFDHNADHVHDHDHGHDDDCQCSQCNYERGRKQENAGDRGLAELEHDASLIERLEMMAGLPTTSEFVSERFTVSDFQRADRPVILPRTDSGIPLQAAVDADRSNRVQRQPDSERSVLFESAIELAAFDETRLDETRLDETRLDGTRFAETAGLSVAPADADNAFAGLGIFDV